MRLQLVARDAVLPNWQSRRDDLSIESSWVRVRNSVGVTSSSRLHTQRVAPTKLRNLHPEPFYRQVIPTGLANQHSRNVKASTVVSILKFAISTTNDRCWERPGS
jgi:hypothetical protein